MSNTNIPTPIDASKEQLIQDFKVLVTDAEALLKATASQGGEAVAAMRVKVGESLAVAKVKMLDAEKAALVKAKAAAQEALANAVLARTLSLHIGADVPATIAQLIALPGIGHWTAHYIAMRAMRWSDAFPASDVALHKAMGLAGRPHAAREAELASHAWQPWRSYAVLRAWHTLSTAPSPEANASRVIQKPRRAAKPPCAAESELT